MRGFLRYNKLYNSYFSYFYTKNRQKGKQNHENEAPKW